MAKRGGAYEGNGRGRAAGSSNFGFNAKPRPKKSAGKKRKPSGIRYWKGMAFGS
jgi:hypothetical protein